MRRSAILLLPVLALTACEEDGVPDDTVATNDDVVQRIIERLAAPAGGFTKFTGSYRDDFDASEAVTVTASCTSCRGEQVIEQVVEAVWQSEIAPLGSISVSVHAPEGYVFESYALPDDETRLTEKYGERPVD
jgi:hypothetical protein